MWVTRLEAGIGKPAARHTAATHGGAGTTGHYPGKRTLCRGPARPADDCEADDRSVRNARGHRLSPANHAWSDRSYTRRQQRPRINQLDPARPGSGNRTSTNGRPPGAFRDDTRIL